MNTNNNISVRRGKASIFSLNRIKKMAKWIAVIILSTITMVLWIIIKPIIKGAGWVLSAITALTIIYWLLTF